MQNLPLNRTVLTTRVSGKAKAKKQKQKQNKQNHKKTTIIIIIIIKKRNKRAWTAGKLPARIDLGIEE